MRSCRTLIALITAQCAAMWLCLAISAQPAVVAGSYETRVSEVTNNCQTSVFTGQTTRLTITVSAGNIAIQLPQIPVLRGTANERGKFNAKAKQAKSATGQAADFALSGNAEKNRLNAVLVIEYFDADKPHCTQSYSLTGTQSG